MILRQIINARKISSLGIKESETEMRRYEARSQLLKEGIFRKDLMTQIEINKNNKQLAVRLFG